MYSISDEAYIKMLLHASKYPHCGLNGILLGKPNGQSYDIMDAIPLFHQTITSPMLEIAFQCIDQYCKEKKFQVVGYYVANALNKVVTLDPVGIKIVDKIEAQCTRACVILIEANTIATLGIKFLLKDVKHGWIPVQDRLSLPNTETTKLFATACGEGAPLEIFDFDDHFEDISKDWKNPNVHQLLQLNVG